jgi:hypothetical protein
MRHPFYTDHLSVHDRRKVRKILVRMLVAYFSVATILVGATVVRIKFVNPQGVPAQQEAIVR